MRKSLVLTVALLFCLVVVYAQVSPLQKKAIVLKRLIELKHYSPVPVNDSFSARMFDKLINQLDNRRLLFTDAEYRSLYNYRLSLDNELTGQSWNFYNQLAAFYNKALTRADSIINKVSLIPFDFSAKESVSFSKEITFNFAQDNKNLANRWARYLKYTALTKLYDIAPEDSASKTNFAAFIRNNEVKIREDVRLSETRSLKKIKDQPGGYNNYLSVLYLDAIATGFDPHTNYLSMEGSEELRSSLSTETNSFGLEFDENSSGHIIIDRLVPGGPAWKSGELNKGDELISLQSEGKEVIDMSGFTLEEVYEMLGYQGNEKLSFRFRKADGTTKDILLRKEKINNEENIVKGFVLKGEKKIGYILLPGFYTEWENETGSSCADDVAKEIVKLKKENIDGLILDVRFNGGGSIKEAMDMIGIFIDEGPLTGQKTDGKEFYIKDANRGTIYNGPMALMVNGQSASASEILAASLQDYNRSLIVGSNTFGKATLQQLFSLDTLAAPSSFDRMNKEIVKITKGKLYRLNGRSAQLNGVTPDIALPDAFDGLEFREKFSPQALSSDSIKGNTYYKPLAPLPVAQLAIRSAERIKNDNEFQNIKNIVALQQRSNKGTITIPLKWDEFEAWIKKQEAELKILAGKAEMPDKKFTADNHSLDKEQNNDDEINKGWLEQIEADIYIRETFLILCDLINLRSPSQKN